MPILKDFRGVKKITLPGYEGVEVEIYDTILFGQAQKLGKIKGDTISLDDTSKLVKEMIKSWNLTDDKGDILPISDENISMLSMDAITHIGVEIAKVVEEAKKKGLNTTPKTQP